MDRALACLGYVCRGIGIAVAFSAGCTVAMAFLFFAGVLTAQVFGLHDEASIAFMVGYMILIAGIAIGIEKCRESA